MTKRMKFPISTARSRIFQLADLVRAGDDAVVVLEQRGGAEPVALVREARLAYLEERVRQLDQSRGAPFTLAGSLASALDDETLERSLREIRDAWAPPERKTARRPMARGKARKRAGR